ELATGAHDPQPQRLYPLEPRGELVPFFQRHRLVLSQLQQSSPMYPIRLSVIDRNSNAEVWNVKPPPTGKILFHSSMNNPRPYFVHGHLAILYLDHTVCCLDMLGRKKVWEKELLSPERLSLDQAGQYQLALDNEGRLQLRNPQGSMENLGRLGPVTGSA